MLSAFNQLLASILALGFLAAILVGPCVGLWIVLSMRRDLRRIADVAEFQYKYPDAAKVLEAHREQELVEERTRRVVHSAFGR